MDDEAVRALARRGVVLTEDARAAGLDDRALRTAHAAELMTRIRPGAYVDAQVWAAMSDEARYRQTVMAAARTLTAPVFSHYSAAALWGLPLVGRWPESVHVVARGASGGRSWRGVIVHGTDLDPPTDVRDGVTVTDPATTVLGVARVAPFATGLAMADHALRAELTTSEVLAAGVDALGSRRAAARARRVVAAADARAESVGESLSRARMIELAVSLPDLQHEVRVDDRLVGRVDFYWPALGLVGEFDGRLKYRTDGIADGRPLEERLWSEKRREDAIRATGLGVTRWTWRTALDPALFAAHLRDAGVLVDGSPRPRVSRVDRASSATRGRAA